MRRSCWWWRGGKVVCRWRGWGGGWGVEGGYWIRGRMRRRVTKSSQMLASTRGWNVFKPRRDLYKKARWQPVVPEKRPAFICTFLSIFRARQKTQRPECLDPRSSIHSTDVFSFRCDAAKYFSVLAFSLGSTRSLFSSTPPSSDNNVHSIFTRPKMGPFLESRFNLPIWDFFALFSGIL